jgi:hypothetical protein
LESKRFGEGKRERDGATYAVFLCFLKYVCMYDEPCDGISNQELVLYLK